MNIIDELNERFIKYFSLDIFNREYLPIINSFITQKTQEIENVISFINSQHNIYKNLGTIKEDNKIGDDYYICFEMKCSGKYTDYKFCVKFNYNKYIIETTYSIYEQGYVDDIEEIEDASSLVNEKANYYNSKMKMINESISNITKETIDKNMTKDYLLPIQNEINLLLNQKYGEELIKKSYNYYKNNTENKLENTLYDINNKLNDSFNALQEEIENNLPNFKYSIKEFGFMSQLYESLITNNISLSYFDSINYLQKYDFNYVMSYHYNYLLKLINSTYSYINNNIPSNEMMLNNIIDLRKQEINDVINNIFLNLKESKKEVLNIDNQINILHAEKSNFFKVNSIFLNISEKINNDLNDNINKISKIQNNISDDEYSITSKSLTEISNFDKQIISFYDIDELSIELNKENFKELMINNLIFDHDDIINRVSLLLYNSNQEVDKNLVIIKENYTLELEKEIHKYFTKENMIKRINELYNNGIKEFNDNKMEYYRQNLYEMLDLIYEYFKSESSRISKSTVSYNSNFTKINNTIKNYKQKIFNETKKIYTNVLKEFRDNVMNNVYKEYVEKGLDGYILECKKITKNFKKYNLLNSSYNLEEIINNIIDELIYEYKEFVKKQIDYKYQTKLNYMFALEDLEEFIEYEVELEYSESLFPALKKVAVYQTGDAGYIEYDFDDNIKNNIDSTLNNNINNIRNLFLSLKAGNYQANINNWENLDFSNINLKLADIENNFEKFILSERDNEKNNINESMKDIIKSNFNLLFNNILSSFGNQFFERSIKYNELLKINNLYDNLKYSLFQTSSYYLNLFDNNEIKTFPKELKKIFNLGDIELLIEKNNNNLLEILSTRIKELIDDTKDNLINEYLSFIKNDTFITYSFNQNIRQMIDNNCDLILPDIENEYNNTLYSYLNDSFIVPYNLIINEKTNEIIDYINETRNKLMNHIDNHLTLESENILEEKNLLIKKILDLINDYNSTNEIFLMPDELIIFLNNLGRNYIKPIYDEFNNKADMGISEGMINFEEKVKNYTNSIDLNLNEFLKNANETYVLLKENYINNMTNYIKNYYDNYSQMFLEENNIIINKSYEETYQKLKNNTKLLIESLNEFKDYDKNISKNINNLNYSYEESKKTIEESNSGVETINKYNNKLNDLKEMTLDYYNKINESYYNIINYLNESFTNIYIDMDKFINITDETIIKEYKKIYEEEKPINEEYSEVKEFNETFQNTIKIEEKTYSINAEIKNIIIYSQFIFHLLFEDNYKYLKLEEKIINKIRPKNMEVTIIPQLCEEDKIVFPIDFNKIRKLNYEVQLNYDTKSKNIDVNTTILFDKYTYLIKLYELYEDNECSNAEGLPFCFSNGCKINSTEKNADGKPQMKKPDPKEEEFEF
jgi:hypothetical protein